MPWKNTLDFRSSSDQAHHNIQQAKDYRTKTFIQVSIHTEFRIGDMNVTKVFHWAETSSIAQH